MVINIGVIGFGVIGHGVVSLLQEYGKVLKERINTEIKIKYLVDLDTSNNKGLDLSSIKFTSDYKEVLNDPEVQIVIELIGGTTIAYNIVKEALLAKKNIVTANKALIYEKGEELFEIARSNKVEVRFEASVAGGIPIIKTITESLSGDIITEICAILNGTTNYILTKMDEDNMSFEEALKGAQKLGFAEADPTLDITGGDAAHKIKILSSIAFNTKVDTEKVYRSGIDNLKLEDVMHAKELGYTIKLLGIAKRHEEANAIEAHVYPALIPSASSIASVKNEYNVVMLNSQYLGISHYVGKGAGSKPTATAIVSDVVDIALAIHDKREYPSHRYSEFNSYKTMDIDEITSCFYIRFTTLDKPGILAKITSVLAKHNINIKKIIQKEGDNTHVPIVMITHETKEIDMKTALAEIEAFDSVTEAPSVLHLERI